MKHILFTAPIATGLLLFAGAGIAQAAEVTTSNDAQGDSISYAGTSNAAVEAHATQPNDGNTEGAGVRTVLQIVAWIPQFDDQGNPILDEDGKQVTKAKWGAVPIGQGVNSIVIFHP
jgi:hypothetical protein